MTSVITITYNNFEELKRTLDSIASTPNIQSIVVNGGTCAQTRTFLSTYSGISISEPDQGIADAFNKGILLANGSEIAFLNSGDCLIDSTYYATAAYQLSTNPLIDFIYSNLEILDSKRGMRELMKPRGRVNLNLGDGLPYPHPTLVVRKTVFEQVGGFSCDYKIGMDFEWEIRLIKMGAKGAYIDRSTVLMESNGVSQTRELEGIVECLRALRNHRLLKPRVLFGFANRLIRYFVRQTITVIGGATLLAYARRALNYLGFLAK